MKAFDITDPQVIRAIAAIDSGNTTELKDLICQYPRLASDRLHNHEEGYFKDPFLLWFVADNPIRTGKLPGNIMEITRELIDAVNSNAPYTYQYQIDCTLGLVASGRIPRECGVQLEMIDLLLDAGASPGSAMTALTNGNLEAAQHLVNRGAKLTLAVAVCLEHNGDIADLAAMASANEKTTALAAAAFYGKAEMIERLLEMKIDPNGFPDADSGFHSHATALHQAVSSGSLACVKLLVETGAKPDVRDKLFDGTPLDWANYLLRDAADEKLKKNFSLIEDYLGSL